MDELSSLEELRLTNRALSTIGKASFTSTPCKSLSAFNVAVEPNQSAAIGLPHEKSPVSMRAFLALCAKGTLLSACLTLTQLANDSVPIAHSFEVLLPCQPSLIVWIDRIAPKNHRRDLNQLHPTRTSPTMLS